MQLVYMKILSIIYNPIRFFFLYDVFIFKLKSFLSLTFEKTNNFYYKKLKAIFSF